MPAVFLTSARVGVKLLKPLAPEGKGDIRFMVRAGEWLFRRRTWLPAPLVLALLLIPPDGRTPSFFLIPLGATLVTCGELLRLWAVRHVGVISRTRGDRLGPLVSTGPFAMVRNPLYLGNIALWVGFALVARLLWLVPVFLLILGLEYHAIVEWEEQLLESRRGDEYHAYLARVPRWIPVAPRQPGAARLPAPYSWRHALFSERGTLIAIGLGCMLVWMKSRV